MLNNIGTIILFLIILAILVLIHELGHFLAAKKFGVRVDEFGLGFPPKMYSKKFGETEYSLNWIPLGGFVRIFGENPDAPAARADIKPGDIIVNIQSPIHGGVIDYSPVTVESFKNVINMSAGNLLNLVIKRGGSETTIERKVVAKQGIIADKYAIGVA